MKKSDCASDIVNLADGCNKKRLPAFLNKEIVYLLLILSCNVKDGVS